MNTMTEQQFDALTLELKQYNSKLMESKTTGENVLTVDMDGTIISEWRLLAFLHRFNVPFQEITFRYRKENEGMALQGRYWATFHK